EQVSTPQSLEDVPPLQPDPSHAPDPLLLELAPPSQPVDEPPVDPVVPVDDVLPPPSVSLSASESASASPSVVPPPDVEEVESVPSCSSTSGPLQPPTWTFALTERSMSGQRSRYTPFPSSVRANHTSAGPTRSSNDWASASSGSTVPAATTASRSVPSRR